MVKKYQINDRRPIKEIFRKMAYRMTDICVALKIKANTISYSSVVVSMIGGALLWFSAKTPWLLLLVPVAAILRLYLNMLDGMVAIKAGEANPWGEVVNELPDRISDVVFFVGLAHTAWANTVLCYWVIIGMLLVTYVGMLGKATGAHRQFGGVMPKPVRMYFLAAASVLQFVLASSPESAAVLFGFSVFDITILFILTGLAQTLVSRTLRIYFELQRIKGRP